jgi:ankyrin repeat protein
LGDIDKVRAFLNEDPDQVHLRGHHGSTALHQAKTAEIAQLLLDRGADINARDEGHQSTPITWATTDNRDAEVIETLLKNGAETDIYVATWLGDLSKVRAFLGQDPDLAQALCPFPDLWGGFTALHIAAFRGHAQIASLLLERGADTQTRRVIPPDGNQSYAQDALQIAQRSDKKDIIELFS